VTGPPDQSPTAQPSRGAGGDAPADRGSADNQAGSAVWVLRRWQDSGGVWRVVSRSAGRVDVALLTCDGGEEMDRLTSTDPAVLDFIGARSSSDEQSP
jgi:hypothetical protein